MKIWRRRTKITNYIGDLYEKEKEKVIEILKDEQHIALTSDGGTSSNAVSFQATNAHYIDDNFDLQYRCLGVIENKEEHNADNYRQNTEDLKEEFGIVEKISLTITDNEPKMQKAVSKEERSGCCSHIIHSSVTVGIKGVNVVLMTVEKIRRISQKHNKLYAFRYGLQREQNKMGIPVRPLHQDCPTRWGSTRVHLPPSWTKKMRKKILSLGKLKVSEMQRR